MRTMIQTMYHIKTDVFGRDDIEVKATQMIRPRVLTKYPRGKVCADRILREIIARLPSLRVFAVVMDHPERVPYQLLGDTTLLQHYRFLLQRIHAYVPKASTKRALWSLTLAMTAKIAKSPAR